MIKFEVKKIDGSLSFEAEIECSEENSISIKLGLAVKWALENQANLSEANLSGADLSEANLFRADLSEANMFRADLSEAYLSEAYLSGANLFRADLSGADLSWANLFRADLSWANLSEANLSGADLSEANLFRANLSGADLSGADLSEANLFRANLFRANLSEANLFRANLSEANLFRAYLSKTTLRVFKHDFWGILLRFKNEVPELIRYLKEGKINGSVYSGECACLIGTFANIKHCNIDDEQFQIKDPKSPAEQWFMMIKQGNTPENNFASKMALQWAEEFLLLQYERKTAK